jgi:F0F1-type ATP synthase delta subunit
MIEIKDIYGKPTMAMPDQNTLIALEARKQFLLQKIQSNLDNSDSADTGRQSYLIREAVAMEKTINFINWLINNSETDMIKNIVEKYTTENKN